MKMEKRLDQDRQQTGGFQGGDDEERRRTKRSIHNIFERKEERQNRS
jgi:hypothetical protein